MIQIVQTHSNNGCLLAYSFDTYPTPLQVSPAGDKRQHGIITVVVSNPDTQPVYCEQIKITLPIGVEPSELTNTPETISAFVYTNDAAKAWEVQNDKNGVLTATPKAEREITSSDSLVFYIYYIQVNKKTGTFSLNIAEETSNTLDANFTSKTHEQSFSKFPHGFFFKDLALYKETQQEGNTVLTPITELDNSGDGERITLTWQGASNATYTLFYPENPAGVPIPEGQRSWTSPEPIRDTTTFLLRATAGQDEEEVSAYLSTTLVVHKPDIQAKSLNVTSLNSDRSITASGNINTNGKIQENGNDLLPQGSIIMWWGATDDIPAGWTLCDGKEIEGRKIPDLQDRFVVGGGGGYEAGTSGQAKIHIPDVRTNSAGAHSHRFPSEWTNIRFREGGAGRTDAGIDRKGTNIDTVRTQSSGAHNHMLTINEEGSNITVQPKYYALAYIMKL